MLGRTRDLRLTHLLSLSLALTSAGCLDRELKPLNPCLVEGVNIEVSIDKIDKVDLLFMVDDSQSMQQEQQALSQQFKNIITVLTTGKRGNGKPDFTPAKDLHLAVISSDMGLPGIGDVKMCTGVGDDGIMQNEGKLAGCNASYPRFLTYDAKTNTPEQTANDFACIATLGTGGCGFEQQLESTLKALWPSVDPLTLDGTNRVRFVGDVDGSKQVGHGDTDNAGFLRTDPAKGLSLLAVVLVTDEEDCSVMDPTVLAPRNWLDPDDPFEAKLAGEGLNVRCALNEDKLFKTARYVDALKALRPGHEDLVVFAAIVGVPTETVNDAVLAGTDFKNDASRARFYQGILDHPKMQPMIDDLGTSDPDDDAIRPSCDTLTGTAYPPRRIVEVAKGFGSNGIVQSICQSDFTPAVNAIVDLISVHITAACLPRALVRNKQGVVDCDVMWELPAPGHGPSNTPTSCMDPSFPFLRPPKDGEEPTDGHGHARCRIPQLAVEGSAPDQHTVPTLTDEVMFQDGWFYDSFTPELHQDCDRVHQPQRIAFTAAATPPTGVTVKLECLDETQHLAQERVDLASGKQPAIGDPCADVTRNGQPLSGDAACALTLANGQPDAHMFCHPDHQVCVLGCATDADCPPAWVCDQRQETLMSSNGRPFCVNPTCGDKE